MVIKSPPLPRQIFPYLFLALSLGFLGPMKAKADLHPKVKVVGRLALYGTVGGALLGTATMAYGSGARSIFQGASLGLYAGLIFGAYVVFTHPDKKSRASGAYPSDEGSPYQSGGSGGGKDEGEFNLENRWNPYALHKDLGGGRQMRKERGKSREGGGNSPPPFYLNFFHWQF